MCLLAGESLVGKRCLVWINQGLGDQLIFSRYLTELLVDAASVTVVCDERMIPLFEELYPKAQFFSQSDEDKTRARLKADIFDYQMFGADIPMHRRETCLEGEVFSTFQLADTDHPLSTENLKVGLCWRSTFRGRPDLLDRWSIDPSALSLFFNCSGISFADLQHGKEIEFTAQEQDFKKRLEQDKVRNANGSVKEFMQFINKQDLIISIDSSVAIFAAMLGKATWVLSPMDPFWFLAANEKTNWFSEVSLFRKPWNQSWSKFLHTTILPRLKAYSNDS